MDRRRFLKMVAAAAAAPALLPAWAQGRALPEGVKRGFAPRDASLAAWLHLSRNVPAHLHPYAWFVFDNYGTPQSNAAINFTVNAVLSQASTIIKPVVLAGGKVLMYFLGSDKYAPDVPVLCPKKKDFDRLWGVLQELAQFEPYFHQPSATGAQIKKIRVSVPPYVATDGKTYDYITKTIIDKRKFEFGIHAGGAGPLRLLSDQLGGNLIPICRGDWLICTAWSSIDIDGIHGRYYDFRGIERNPRGKTAFDAYLERVDTNRSRVDERNLDRRFVMLSGITGRWRLGEVLPTLGAIDYGPSVIRISRDINNKEEGARRHPWLNLLDFEDQAREIIGTMPNGLDEFLLTDGKGNLVNEVPPDVAPWRESPHHGSASLINGVGCMACHGRVGGTQLTRNVVQEAAAKGFVPKFDLSQSKLSPAEVAEKLKSKYRKSDLNLILKQRANGYAAAVDEASLGAFPAKDGKLNTVERVTGETFKMYSEYVAHLGPQRMIQDLGYTYDGESPDVALGQLVPESADEDGRVGLARLCFDIRRTDFHEVYYEMALRDQFKPEEWKP